MLGTKTRFKRWTYAVMAIALIQTSSHAHAAKTTLSRPATVLHMWEQTSTGQDAAILRAVGPSTGRVHIVQIARRGLQLAVMEAELKGDVGRATMFEAQLDSPTDTTFELRQVMSRSATSQDRDLLAAAHARFDLLCDLACAELAAAVTDLTIAVCVVSEGVACPEAAAGGGFVVGAGCASMGCGENFSSTYALSCNGGTYGENNPGSTTTGRIQIDVTCSREVASITVHLSPYRQVGTFAGAKKSNTRSTFATTVTSVCYSTAYCHYDTGFTPPKGECWRTTGTFDVDDYQLPHAKYTGASAEFSTSLVCNLPNLQATGTAAPL